MMKKFKVLKSVSYFFIASLIVIAVGSCVGADAGGVSYGSPTAEDPGEKSTTTGIYFNTEAGFKVGDFEGQPDGPNLVFIEGGRTTLGSFEEDVISMRDNLERTVTVASFYMDETEVANIHWLEFEYYIKRDSDEYFWRNNIPDTTVWADDLAFNDPYVSNYYRYPGFRYFPVVGVNWRQAINYCKWRTNVVNLSLAWEAGYIDDDGNATSPENSRKKKKNRKKNRKGGGDAEGGDDVDAAVAASAASGSQGGGLGASSSNPLELASGLILPGYRLPTEAEWEYAAQALIGTQYLDENQTHKRLYPWDGHSLRNPYGRGQGYFLANFKRGNGDYAGIAGKLNDGAMITTYIYDYPPNDYGLFNMAGNVNEWVQDVYRPLTFQDLDDLNPARRDNTLDNEKGYDGNYNYIGREGEYSEDRWIKVSGLQKSYNQDAPPMRRVRVYKGGSWKDVAYWLSPGTRRYMFEDSASSTLGFRCAMIRAGSNY